MKIVKIIGMILLAVYIFFSSAFHMFGFQAPTMINFLLGLCGVGAGVLMLLSIREFMHYHRE